MASSYPMLRYGSSGQEVRRLQQALNRAGYSLEVDGGFGEKTRAALMDYQRRVGTWARRQISWKAAAETASVA